MSAQSRELTVHGEISTILDEGNRMVSTSFQIHEALEKGVEVNGFDTHPDSEGHQSGMFNGEVVRIIGKLINLPAASIGVINYEGYVDLVGRRCKELGFEIDWT
jgi:hypothetical protein